MLTERLLACCLPLNAGDEARRAAAGAAVVVVGGWAIARLKREFVVDVEREVSSFAIAGE